MRAHDILNREEIIHLMTKSNVRAMYIVVSCWLVVVAALMMVAIWPNPLTVILAILLIAGRQLSFAILMHDCGHNSLFQSTWLNKLVGTWLVAAPILSDMQSYSRQHSIHHRDVGTANDPDLANYEAYPISRASLMRKFSRDLLGITAVKYWMYLLKTRAPSQHSIVTNQALLRGLIVNVVLWLLCYLANQAWLFLIWVIAFHTAYFLFLRIRHIGEHAAVPDANSPNMFENTRTTRANWWARLFVCPVYVNYHIEHHLLPSVPPYKLVTMHKWLVAKQAYKNTAVPKGYLSMLRSVLI